MATIADADRNVFSEADKTVLDFNYDEQKQLHKLAEQLKTIIETAKKCGGTGYGAGGYGQRGYGK
jgi:hypothetical protein